MSVFSRRGIAAAIVALATVLAFQSPSFSQGRSFKDQDLAGRDFSHQRLDGADFSGANLERTNFTGASLRGANFQDAILRNTNFSHANVSGADFRKAEGPFFQASDDSSRTNFSNANFEGYDFKKGSLFKANMTGANLRDTTNYGDLFGAVLTGADLSGANLLSMMNGGPTNARVFRGTFYDDDTSWPSFVDPEAQGAMKRQK